MTTQPIYATDMQCLRTVASVVDVRFSSEGAMILLDRTNFYPQGGGQACDTGVIAGRMFRFRVDSVRMIDGVIVHSGRAIHGDVNPGTDVSLEVDAERRALNSRLQTGGHLLVNAMRRVGRDAAPIRGYHFPDRPHVDFALSADDSELSMLADALQAAVDELIASEFPVVLEILSHAAARERGVMVPNGVPSGVPLRVVSIDGLAQACGGTHVASLSALRGMRVLGARVRKGQLRIEYAVPDSECVR